MSHKPGDVVNGYVLTSTNEWIPTSSQATQTIATPQDAPVQVTPEKATSTGKKVAIGIGAGLAGLIVITAIASAASSSETDTPAQDTSAVVAEAPAAPAPVTPAAPAAPVAPAEPSAPSEQPSPVNAFGEAFTMSDGSTLVVSNIRQEADPLGDAVTVVDVTYTNNSGEIRELNAFTAIINATSNGITADWSLLGSTPFDVDALPGKSVTGLYGFEGNLSGEIVVEVSFGWLDNEKAYWTTNV